MRQVTIVLADDHGLVRQGLHSLLADEADFQVLGEASNGIDALALVEQMKPDVLVLDVAMPGLNGLDVAREVCLHFPDTRVIVVSVHADESYVHEALRIPVSGYVLKDSTFDDLVRAIREAMAGRRYLSQPLSEWAIQAYVDKAQATLSDIYETLTVREREVLHLAAEGYTISEIADQLSISCRTVETHRGHVMKKLGLHTHTDLVRYALRRGIISLDA